MGDVTGISWTKHTFNPWIGCTKVSPACEHCYAETLVQNRMGRDFEERRRTSDANWKKPRAWNRAAAEAGVRAKVFCASLADVFDNQVPDEWRWDLWALIRGALHLDWQLLTKRPQNIRKMLPADWGDGYPNVWLGTTVADQTEADRNIPVLLSVPAARRFISAEPLLGPLSLLKMRDGPHTFSALDGHEDNAGTGQCVGWTPPLDWIICGGESGPEARPMHPNWARALRDQCATAGVPFFFKQWGEWAPDIITGRNGWPYDEDTDCWRIGKKRAGALLDGREHKAFPHG